MNKIHENSVWFLLFLLFQLLPSSDLWSLHSERSRGLLQCLSASWRCRFFSSRRCLRMAILSSLLCRLVLPPARCSSSPSSPSSPCSSPSASSVACQDTHTTRWNRVFVWAQSHDMKPHWAQVTRDPSGSGSLDTHGRRSMGTLRLRGAEGLICPKFYT